MVCSFFIFLLHIKYNPPFFDFIWLFTMTVREKTWAVLSESIPFPPTMVLLFWRVFCVALSTHKDMALASLKDCEQRGFLYIHFHQYHILGLESTLILNHFELWTEAKFIFDRHFHLVKLSCFVHAEIVQTTNEFKFLSYSGLLVFNRAIQTV